MSFGGSGADRTLKVTPAANASGSTTITVTVTDGNGATASESFIVTVSAVNDVPTITSIADQVVLEDTPTAAIPFTVADAETLVVNLTVTAQSSNTVLVPNSSIAIVRNGLNHSVRITPAANRFGTTTITLMVTDEAGTSATETFLLTVNATDDRVLVPFSLPQSVGGQLSGVSSLSPVDFDGDGKLDVLAGAYGAGQVAWVKNLGGGTFGALQVIDAAATDTWFTKASDIDGDGDQDVVAGMYSGTLAWYENNGSGVFTKVVLDTALTGPWLAVGDLNGDGLQDILAGPDGGSSIYAYMQLSDGSFVQRLELVSGLNGLAGIILADVNNDSLTDLVIGGGLDNKIYWHLNQGGGALGAQRSVDAGLYAGLLDLQDLNGDGFKDIVSLEYTSQRVVWYASSGDGSFGTRNELPAVLTGPYAVTVADFDNDFDLDVAIATYSSEPEFVWLVNRGGGVFDAPLAISSAMGQVSMLASADFDQDGDSDIVLGSFSGSQISLFENQLGEFATVVVPPAAGDYLRGFTIESTVYFGYPVTVTGTPEIDLLIGNRTVKALYVSGSGTPSLKFAYQVVEEDRDDDGISLLSTAIRLAGGTITNSIGAPADLTLPPSDFRGALVNGSAPFPLSIVRLDPTPTNCDEVHFLVEFSEDVEGVDLQDFAVALTGDLVDVQIVEVSGSGSTYTVKVTTGSGSGTIALSVPDDASISDLLDNSLGKGFVGGERYTLLRGGEVVVDDFFTGDHGDIAVGFNAGEFSMNVHTEAGEFPSNEVMIYGGPEGLNVRPDGDAFDFLGVNAGEPIYIWPQNGSIVELPDLGVGAEEIAGGSLAAYLNNDERVETTGAWVQMQLVGMRGPDGGHFAMFRSLDEGPRVWFATADGITEADKLWILEGSHQHFTFAFTESGVYEVDVIVSGFVDANGNGVYDENIDAYTESGVKTLVFGIDLPGGPTDYVIPAGMEGRAPVASDDTFAVTTGDSGNRLFGNVLFNDTDPNGDSLSAILKTQPAHGELIFESSGAFTYTPNSTFTTSDSFSYCVTDGNGGCSVATVTIESAIEPEFLTTLTAGHADIGIAFADGAFEPHIHDEEEDIEYAPNEALLAVESGAFVQRVGALAAPQYDFIGADAGSFFYRLPQNVNPLLLALGLSTEEIEAGTFQEGELYVRLKAVNGPGHFSAWLDLDEGPAELMSTADGVTVIDMATLLEGGHQHANFGFTALGDYAITIDAWAVLPDGSIVTSEEATYYFEVRNAAPIAASDSFVVLAGNSVMGNVLFNDSDVEGDVITSALLVSPTTGTVVLAADGSFRYQPSATFSGSDSFTYTLTDSRGSESIGTVTITLGVKPTFIAFLVNEHVDIGFGYADGVWEPHIHDETRDLEFETDEAVFTVDANASTPRPASSAFDFIGAAANSNFFLLSQTLSPQAVLAGLATEEIAPGTFQDGEVHVRLKHVNGPGHFSMWRSLDDGPEVFMSTAGGITEASLLTMLEAGHEEMNFGFTAAGHYVVAFEAFAVLPDGTVVSSGDAAYHFSVGLDRRDVNGDGQISPIDALLVINRLNRDRINDPQPSEGRLNTNRDSSISPVDALLVINVLNQRSSGGGEGEGSAARSMTSSTTYNSSLPSDVALATDFALDQLLKGDSFANDGLRRRRWGR